MRKGTNTGKCDCNYNAIKVGDTVISTISARTFKVDEYGSHVRQAGSNTEKLAPKEWDGCNYRIIEESEPEAPKMTSEEVNEALESEATLEETNGGSAGEGGTMKPDGEPIELIEDDPGATVHPLAGATDQELADELRFRGYEVRAFRTVTIEL